VGILSNEFAVSLVEAVDTSVRMLRLSSVDAGGAGDKLFLLWKEGAAGFNFGVTGLAEGFGFDAVGKSWLVGCCWLGSSERDAVELLFVAAFGDIGLETGRERERRKSFQCVPSPEGRLRCVATGSPIGAGHPKAAETFELGAGSAFSKDAIEEGLGDAGFVPEFSNSVIGSIGSKFGLN
jgi:hypothetical protein